MTPDDATSGRTRGPAATLRAAIEAAPPHPGDEPVPVFSPDGGVTVSDRWGRTARLQPLGRRVRVTLADQQRYVAEGEVDADALAADIRRHGSTYDAVAAALGVENGPGGSSR